MKSDLVTSRPASRLRRSAAVAAAALVGVIAVGPAAQAAQSAQPVQAAHAGAAPSMAAFSADSLRTLKEIVAIPAGTGTYNTTVHGVHISVARNAKPATGTECSLIADAPTVQNGDVAGAAFVTCTGEVYAIAIEVALFCNGVEESYNTNSGTYTDFVSQYTEIPSSTGSWQTAAVADVYWTSPSSYVQLGPTVSSAISVP